MGSFDDDLADVQEIENQTVTADTNSGSSFDFDLEDTAITEADNMEEKGTTEWTPDFSMGRLSGAAYEELKRGVSDRLQGTAQLQLGAQDRGAAARARRREEIIKFYEVSGKQKQVRDMKKVNRTQFAKYEAETILSAIASDALAADPDFEVSSGFIENQVRSLVQLGSQIVIGTLGGPGVAIPDMGLMIAGGTYSRLKKENPNMDEGRLRQAAFMNAAGQAPMEYAGAFANKVPGMKKGLTYIDNVTKPLQKKAAKALQKKAIGMVGWMIKKAGPEMATEYFQDITAEQFSALWATHPDGGAINAWVDKLSEWKTHDQALRQAGHAGLSTLILRGAGKGVRVAQQRIVDKQVEQVKAEVEAKQAAKDALPDDPTPEEMAQAMTMEEVALAEEAAIDKRTKEAKDKPLSKLKEKEKALETPKPKTTKKPKPKKAKKQEEVEAVEEVTEEDIKTFEDMAKEAGNLKTPGKKASVEKVLAKLRKEVKPVEEEIAPKTEDKPDVKLEKLPKKIKKETSLTDLDKQTVPEGQEAKEIQEDKTDTAAKELGLDIEPTSTIDDLTKQPTGLEAAETMDGEKTIKELRAYAKQHGLEPKGRTKADIRASIKAQEIEQAKDIPKPPPQKVSSGYSKTGKAGAYVDGKIVETIDIPKVKGAGLHTDEDRKAWDKAIQTLREKWGDKGDIGFVDDDGRFVTREQFAEDRGLEEDILEEATKGEEGKGALYRGKKGKQEADVADRRQNKKNQKLVDEADMAKKLEKGTPERAEFDRKMKLIRGAANRMSKGNKADQHELENETAIALLKEMQKPKSERKEKWSPTLPMKTALAEIRRRGFANSRRSVEEGTVPGVSEFKDTMTQKKGASVASQDVDEGSGNIEGEGRDKMTDRPEETRTKSYLEIASKSKEIQTEQDMIEEVVKEAGIKIGATPAETLKNINKKIEDTDATGADLTFYQKMRMAVKNNLLGTKDFDTSQYNKAEKPAVLAEAKARRMADIAQLQAQNKLRTRIPTREKDPDALVAAEHGLTGALLEKRDRILKRQANVRNTFEAMGRPVPKSILNRQKAELKRELGTTMQPSTEDYIAAIIPGKLGPPAEAEAALKKIQAGQMLAQDVKHMKVFDPELATVELLPSGSHWRKKGTAKAALKSKKIADPIKYKNATVVEVVKDKKYAINVPGPEIKQILPKIEKASEPQAPMRRVPVDRAIETIDADRRRFDREWKEALEMVEGSPQRIAKLQRMQDRVDKNRKRLQVLERKNATAKQKKKMSEQRARLKESQDTLDSLYADGIFPVNAVPAPAPAPSVKAEEKAAAEAAALPTIDEMNDAVYNAGIATENMTVDEIINKYQEISAPFSMEATGGYTIQESKDAIPGRFDVYDGEDLIDTNLELDTIKENYGVEPDKNVLQRAADLFLNNKGELVLRHGKKKKTLNADDIAALKAYRDRKLAKQNPVRKPDTTPISKPKQYFKGSGKKQINDADRAALEAYRQRSIEKQRLASEKRAAYAAKQEGKIVPELDVRVGGREAAPAVGPKRTTAEIEKDFGVDAPDVDITSEPARIYNKNVSEHDMALFKAEVKRNNAQFEATGEGTIYSEMFGNIVDNERGGMTVSIPGTDAILSLPKKWTALVDRIREGGARLAVGTAQSNSAVDYVMTGLVNKFGIDPTLKELMKSKELSKHNMNVMADRLAEATKRIDDEVAKTTNLFSTVNVKRGGRVVGTRPMTKGEAEKRRKAFQRRKQQIAEGSITNLTDQTVALRMVIKEFQKMERELRKRGMLNDHQFRQLNNKERAKAINEIHALDEKIVAKEISSLPQAKIDKAVKIMKKDRFDLIARLQIHYKNSGVNYLRHIKDNLEQNERYMKRFTLDAMSLGFTKRRQNWVTNVDKETGIVTVRRTKPGKKKRTDVPKVADMVYKGLSQEAHDLHLFDLYSKIANSESDFEFTDQGALGPWATKTPDQFSGVDYLPMPNNAHFGPLAGMHVEKHIFADMKTNWEEVSDFTKATRKVFKNWKGFKTIWNPATQVRNFVSNMALAHVVGDVNFFKKETYKDWRQSFKDQIAVSKGLIPQSKYGQEILEQTTIYENTFAKQELGEGDAITAIVNMMAEDIQRLVPAAVGTAKVMGLLAKSGPAAYQAAEVSMKSVVYSAARDRGESIESAGELAEKALFNYNEVPPGIKWARNYYSPFVTFTYKAIPALATAVARKPWKLAPYYGLVYTAEALSNMILGEDDEDAEMKKRKLPDHMDRDLLPGMPSHIRMPFRTSDGDDKYFDLSFILPWGMLTDMGEGPLGFVPDWLQPNTPFLTVPAALLANVDLFTGQPITLESDSLGTEVWKTFKKIAKEASPGFLNWDKMDKTIGAFYGDKTPLVRNEGYTVPEAIADWFLGIKIRNINYAEHSMWRHNDLQKRATEVKGEYIKKWNKINGTQAGRHSEESQRKLNDSILMDFNTKMEDIVEEYHYRFMKDNDND